jgi:fibronectin type 3 domain-containing protein
MKKLSLFLLLSVISAVGQSHSVHLSWVIPSSGCSKGCTYNLYRGLTSGSEVKIISGITTISYIDSSTIDGNTYYYEVTAVNGKESPKSNELQVLIPNGTIPSPPINLVIITQ